MMMIWVAVALWTNVIGVCLFRRQVEGASNASVVLALVWVTVPAVYVTFWVLIPAYYGVAQ